MAMTKTMINAIKSWVEKNFVTRSFAKQTFASKEEVEYYAQQSDWNENDENSPSYVKNRIGGYIGEVVVFDEEVMLSYSSGLGGYWYNDLPEILFGDKVFVSIDGDEYILVKDENDTDDYSRDVHWYNFNENGDKIAPLLYPNNNKWRIGFGYDYDYTITHHIVLKTETIVTIPKEYIDEDIKYSINDTINMISKKMNSYNPTASGSFSLNRKFMSTIGNYSFAEGYETTADSNYSHAEGYRTVAHHASHAEGDNTVAYYTSHSEGNNTIASGECSHSEGNNTIASGECSHTEGYSSKTGGEFSDISGTFYNSKGDGFASHAEGCGTVAKGKCSHTEGCHNIASGECSHAEGRNNTASSWSSHAEGYGTTASGRYSHSEGVNTIASGSHQHVQGQYNISDTTLAHIVGNGNESVVNGGVVNRILSNAHTLDWKGNAWYAGDVYVGSTSGTNRDDGSKKLATEDYVDSLILGLSEEIDGLIIEKINKSIDPIETLADEILEVL